MASINEMINLAQYQSGPGRLTGKGGGGGWISAIMNARDEILKKQEEKQKKQLDMYKTLRDMGYTSKQAYESMQKDKIDFAKLGPPGDTLETEKEQLGIQKTKAEIFKTKAETIKASRKTPANRKALEDSILDEVSRGITLTPGKQKIYDEVIKKQAPGGATSDNALDKVSQANQQFQTTQGKEETIPTPGKQKIYDEVIKKQAPGGATSDNALDKVSQANQQFQTTQGKEETIPMIAPGGKRWNIYKSKVPAAIKKGYKKI